MVSLFEQPYVDILDALNYTVRPKSAERIRLQEAGSRKKFAFLNSEVDAKRILFNMVFNSHRSMCKKLEQPPDDATMDARMPHFLLSKAAKKTREQLSRGSLSAPYVEGDEPKALPTFTVFMPRTMSLKEDSEKLRQIDDGKMFTESVRYLGILSGEHFKRSSLRFTSRIHKAAADHSHVVLSKSERAG